VHSQPAEVDPRIQRAGFAEAFVAPLLALVSLLARGSKVLGLETVEGRLHALRDEARGHRLLYYHWIEDVLPRLVIARRSGTQLDADAVSVCDDTLGGRLGAAVMIALGRRILPLRVSHGALRIKDLHGLIREAAPLSIAADGRGPYGRVHPSLPRLVEMRSAIAVPVSVLASPALRSRHGGRIALPMPRARLAIGLGSPIMAVGPGARVTVEALEHGLREARAESLSLLAASWGVNDRISRRS